METTFVLEVVPEDFIPDTQHTEEIPVSEEIFADNQTPSLPGFERVAA